MDAIKKKMQAMKIEKDNAMDRADQCEQAAKAAKVKPISAPEEMVPILSNMVMLAFKAFSFQCQLQQGQRVYILFLRSPPPPPNHHHHDHDDHDQDHHHHDHDDHDQVRSDKAEEEVAELMKKAEQLEVELDKTKEELVIVFMIWMMMVMAIVMI